MERWKAEGVHSGAPPGKLAARVKRWRCRRVTHTTQAPLPQHLSQSASTSTCFRVSGCQAAGWRRQGKAGVCGGGWVVAAAIDLWSASFCHFQLRATLPAAACASFGQPTRSEPQPAARRCLESTTEETAAPPTGGRCTRRWIGSGLKKKRGGRNV